MSAHSVFSNITSLGFHFYWIIKKKRKKKRYRALSLSIATSDQYKIFLVLQFNLLNFMPNDNAKTAVPKGSYVLF